MGVNKVIGKNNEVVLDLTDDTVTPYNLATGITAHNAAGDPIIGVGGLDVSAIYDNAGYGDYDKAWSADKTYTEITDLKQQIATGGVHNEGAWSSSQSYTQFATVTNAGSSYLALEDVPAGTSLTNTVYWQKLAEAGGAENIDDTAGEGDTNKVWSADKVDDLLYKDITNNRYSEASNCNLAIFKCAKTWVDNYDEHIYYGNDGNPNSVNRVNGVNTMVTDIKPGTVVDGKYPLDCMSFVMMCLMGIGYEESIFGDKSNVAKYPRADIPFLSDEFMKWAYYYNSNELPFDYTLPDNFTWKRVLTWQFAGYLASKGLYHEVESDYKLAALQPGDICFFVNSSEHSDLFKNIGHVSIYVGKTRFGDILVLENGHAIVKSKNTFLSVLAGYARIPLSETVTPHNILKSTSSGYLGNSTNAMLIDRPVNKYDIYLIRYSFRFADNSDVGKMTPAFGIFYGLNAANNMNPFTYARYNASDASQKFAVNKTYEDEIYLFLDKTYADNFSYDYKYLMSGVFGENQYNGNGEITITEVIPVMTNVDEAISVPYIVPITCSALTDAVTVIQKLTTLMHIPQVIRSYVYITINNVTDKYYLKISYVSGMDFEIIMLKPDLTGIKKTVINGSSTVTTYDSNSKATFDMLASVLPNNP